jgi:hypothetical protein
MVPSQPIFQSFSWEEMFPSTGSSRMGMIVNKEGSHRKKLLVNTVKARVRRLRRARLQSTTKHKTITKSYASDLLSTTKSKVRDNLLTTKNDAETGTTNTWDSIFNDSGCKYVCFEHVTDEMSDMSLSSVEEDCPESMVLMFGMHFLLHRCFSAD